MVFAITGVVMDVLPCTSCALFVVVEGIGVVVGDSFWCTVVACEVLVSVRNLAVGSAVAAHSNGSAQLLAPSLGLSKLLGVLAHPTFLSLYK